MRPLEVQKTCARVESSMRLSHSRRSGPDHNERRSESQRRQMVTSLEALLNISSRSYP